METDKIIYLTEERIGEMLEQSILRQQLGVVFKNQKVGAVTPCVPTLEAAQKLAEKGGAVLPKGQATGVVIPPKIGQ